jgi:hypothetical protein
MQVSQRAEFEILLEKLYAGFNMPISEARKAAYWDGLAKMSLGQFSSVVDIALGENGPERIPPVPALWKILKSAKQVATAPIEKPTEPDHLSYFANRLLMTQLTNRGGLGSTGRFVAPRGMVDCESSPELAACLKVKAEVVEFFLELIAEGSKHATPAEFVTMWAKHLREVSVISPKALAAYLRIMGSEEAKRPFPAYMGRKVA